uniref:Ig-like domain-containing protein n=1 Tax=Anabas testudineus TaxID=64144 RepID=A0A7N6AX31_ANATE
MPQMNRLSIGPQIRTISVLVVHFLLLLFNKGQSKLIGLSQPIVATVGDDTVLPCRLEPAVDVAAKTLEWTRSNLNPRFVFVWRAGQDLVNTKHPSFRGRTSLFTDELKQGNISLKLSKVKLSDEGRYRCYIPEKNEESLVELVVGAAASPVISLAGIDRGKAGVVLQCESKGWYPEPELLWLDAEGKILSAGPTETIRGPDDLYTVSSRVTVEKRHSNNITCRVQQRNINQIRDTHIHVPDDFFDIQTSYSAAIVGFAVSLAVCILFILLLVFFLWKKNIIKSKRHQGDESDHAVKKNFSKSKTENLNSTKKEKGRELFMTNESVQMEDFNKNKAEKTSKQKQLMREEAANRVKNLIKELETKKKEVKKKEAELEQLQEENQNIEKNLQTLRKKLENKNTELQPRKASIAQYSRFTRHDYNKVQDPTDKSYQKKMEAEREVESLTKELETTEKQLQTKIEEFKEKQAEVQQLQEEIQRMETNNTELGTSGAAPARSSSLLLERQLQAEKQRREAAENSNRELNKTITELKTRLLAEQQKRTKETENLKNPESTIRELYNQLQTEKKSKELNWHLNTEKQRRIKAEQTIKELETKPQTEKSKEEAEKKIRELKWHLQTENQRRMNAEQTIQELNWHLQTENQRKMKAEQTIKE